ncbi:DUF4433 domain-containing protein [Knoellia locipacati]|uniref:type II toxin-antitoxin system toxin DNA ADP-ribosyl transferase DarT n=1 Tax=Knoellia locipacati TaxID=882824 RepID=UPI00384E7B9E
MSRPIPTPIMHFTRVEHLPTILAEGLLSDTGAQRSGSLQIEIGHNEIKERRRRLRVDVGPGGVVADYAPFYFSERSPMMYTLSRGNVATYQEGFDRVIYLVSTVEALDDCGCQWVVSDRNAAQSLASFAMGADGLNDSVDWPLMSAMQWGWCAEDPERPDRRAAECLVHEVVPWRAFNEVVARNNSTAEEARAVIAATGHDTPVSVRPDWYF